MNCLQNPPSLRINKALYGPESYSQKAMPLHVRLEQRIVWNLLLLLEIAGFDAINVDDGDEITKVSSKVGAMELLFNLDDAYLYLRHSRGKEKVWIRFVFGNELDVISDYSSGVRRDFEQLMEEFKPEVYA